MYYWRISRYTIETLRRGVELFYQDSIRAIDSFRQYVSRNDTNFERVYNGWLYEINEEREKLYTFIDFMSRETYNEYNYGRHYIYRMWGQKVEEEPWQDRNQVYVTIYGLKRWWEYNQVRKEAVFIDISQSVSLERM